LIYKIIDNGISIPEEMIAYSKGNGLNNMRERVETLDGHIRIKSLDVGGTEIHLEIPLKHVD